MDGRQDGTADKRQSQQRKQHPGEHVRRVLCRGEDFGQNFMRACAAPDEAPHDPAQEKTEKRGDKPLLVAMRGAEQPEDKTIRPRHAGPAPKGIYRSLVLLAS